MTETSNFDYEAKCHNLLSERLIIQHSDTVDRRTSSQLGLMAPIRCPRFGSPLSLQGERRCVSTDAGKDGIKSQQS